MVVAGGYLGMKISRQVWEFETSEFCCSGWKIWRIDECPEVALVEILVAESLRKSSVCLWFSTTNCEARRSRESICYRSSTRLKGVIVDSRESARMYSIIKKQNSIHSVSRIVFIEMGVAGQCQGSGAVRGICASTRKGEEWSEQPCWFSVFAGASWKIFSNSFQKF